MRPWASTGLSELERLVAVELALVEQHAEVLQDEGHLAGQLGQALELLDGVGGAQEAARGAGGDLGGLEEAAGAEELLKLAGVQVVGAGEARRARPS